MNRFGKPYYQAYLMRFWAEGGTDKQRSGVWRFTLEDPHSGERRGFGSLETLIAFLKEQMGEENTQP